MLTWITAGAKGFVPDDATPRQLADAVQAVKRNELLLPPTIALSAIREATTSNEIASRRDMSRLTPRQAEVMALLARGLTNQEIAHALELTLSTVKNHVHLLLEKTQTSSRREVATRLQAARENGNARVAATVTTTQNNSSAE